MKTLVIFTHGSPFSNGENAFLFPELPYLSSRFSRVVLVPDCICHRPDFSCPVKLPDGITVFKESMSGPSRKRISQFRALIGLDWIRELRDFRSFSDFVCELTYTDSVNRFKAEFLRLVRVLNLDLADTLFYAFWMTHESSGLAQLAKDDPHIKFVTRAHGYDLYDYRVPFRSRYYRESTLSTAKGVYCCSRDGADYLNGRCPGHESNVHVAYLGVPCDGVEMAPNPRWPTSELHLVMVANLVPVKQHVKFITALKAFALAHRSCRMVCDIIGDGPERAKIQRAMEGLPDNLAVSMLGLVANKDLMHRYAEVPYDLIVLPSRSEGLSVAVMEAMARGIPAFVTDVGGMRELVEESKTGWLVNGDFTVLDVSRVLTDYLNGDRLSMRTAAISRVRCCFDVAKTRSEFADQLVNVARNG